ncbi:hypothetical protein TWF696_005261 [Orbilia brochopaga]|uniref:Uncharacterized protein n=1 Tax=Orbilia brochopaga TaxID=3140254 RepID=A0AAV9V077_9PEZI
MSHQVTAVENYAGVPSPQNTIIGYMDEEAELQSPEPQFRYDWHRLDEHFLARIEAFCVNNCYRLLREKWGMSTMTAHLELPVVEVDRRIYRDEGVADNTPHPVGISVLHWLTVLADYTANDFPAAKRVLNQAFHDSRNFNHEFAFRQYPNLKYTPAFPPYLTVEDIYNAIQLLRPETYLNNLGEPTKPPKLPPNVPGDHTPRPFWQIPRIAYISADEDPNATTSYLDTPFYGFRVLPDPYPPYEAYETEPILRPGYSSVRVANEAARYLIEIGHMHDQDVLLSTVDHFRKLQQQPWLPEGYRSWTEYTRETVREIDLAFRDRCYLLVTATPRNRTYPSPAVDAATFLGDRFGCGPGTFAARNGTIISRSVRGNVRT